MFLKVFEKLGEDSVKYVRAVPAKEARGLVKKTYRQIRRDFGLLVSPMTLHSACPEILAGVWTAFRETLLAGRLPRAEKEAITARVSRLNACPFCLDVHTMSLHSINEHDLAVALAEGDEEQIEAEHRQLFDRVEWAGESRNPSAEVLCFPPFQEADLAEAIGLVLAFHYINRMANVFLNESIFPVPARFTRIKHLAKKIGALFVKDVVEKYRKPGDSLTLLPAASLPAEFSWAESNRFVSEAFARWSHSIEKAAQQSLPGSLRRTVTEYLSSWNGEDPGLGRGWLMEATHGLEPREIPLARLLLCTAVASYQVDEEMVVSVQDGSEDCFLVTAVSWASLAAVKRISTWLDPVTSVQARTAS